MTRRERLRRAGKTLVCTAALCIALPVRPAAPPTLSVLTLGGGPTRRLNQVAIESNVRYVDGLLPAGCDKTVLFADGKPGTESVLFLDPPEKLSPAETAFRFLFNEDASERPERFRAPRLPRLDGPTSKAAINGAFATVAAKPPAGRFLLYLTGHGSQNKRGDLDNNVFDLWGETLSVRELSVRIDTLPAARPVVLVMVQCYSGAFGNLLFQNGDPAGGKVTERDLCGFFAATRERVAAGCTPEVNEAEYHDFSGYFFAALAGRDRVGRIIAAPDYDKNGVVGMNEAFAYALINEPSIDVPVATSDVFLRRFVPVADDEEIARTPYSTVAALASPAQRAALDGLSRHLSATGESRFRGALANVRARLENRGGGGDGGHDAHTGGGGDSSLQVRELRRAGRRDLEARFPDLRDPKSGAFASARARALAHLQTRPETTSPLVAAARRLDVLGAARYQDEITGARWLRLMRLAKTVVLEGRLRAGGDKALIARFERLKAAEAGNPLRAEAHSP